MTEKPSPPQREGSAVLLLAGDVMTARGIDQALAHPGNPTLHEDFVKDARDYVRLAEAVNGPIGAPLAAEDLWGEALAEMDRVAPDLRIVNLEAAITQAGEPWPGKGIHYRMHPANIGCLRAARFDACALANNHVLDWGRTGLLDTLQTLHSAGIACAGAGTDAAAASAPARLALPRAGRGALLLFAFAVPISGVLAAWAAAPRLPGVALLPDLSAPTASRVADEIGQCRGDGDIVFVSMQWGGNWGLALPQEHRAFAHRLIDAGAADLVHGHSSHHPLPLEVYRGKLISYGCGDLINDYEGIHAHGSLRSDVGCLYFASLHAGNGRLAALEIVPLQMKRFRLQAADAAAKHWLDRVFSGGAAGSGERLLVPGTRGWRLRGMPDTARH